MKALVVISGPRRWVNNLVQQEFLLGLFMALCVGAILFLGFPGLGVSFKTIGLAIVGILAAALIASFWARYQSVRCPECGGVSRYKDFVFKLGEIESCPHTQCHATLKNLL